MLKRLPLLALTVLGLGVLAGSLLQADTPPDTKKIGQLVEKLGSGDFEEREQATEALDKIGLDALDALRKAVKSDDAEMRRRAADLVAKIEKREASTILLKPTRVTLTLKDATVTEALAALRKAGDATFQINDPANTLKDVRITLELKDATYFEALAAVCEKAGLVEGYSGQGQGVGAFPVNPPPLPVRPIKRPLIQPVPPQPVPDLPPQPPVRPEGFAFQAEPAQAETPPGKPVAPRAAVPPPAADVVPPLPPVQVQQIQIGGGGPGIIIGGPAMPFQPGMTGAPGTIVLTPGKGTKFPADVTSAYRVRAVPSHFRMQAPGQTILNTMLEITPEPRLRWAGHESVTITKAIDEQDQKLAQFDPNAVQPGPGGGGIGVGIAFPGGFPGQMAGNATIPLYLKGGEKPTKTLKELAGTIAARVYVPHSDPVVVEKVMDAPGKSVKGEKGGEIKIVEVTREAEAVRIKFELVPAKDAAGGAGENQNGPFPGGFPVPGPGVLIPPMGVAPAILPVAPPQPAPKPDRRAPQVERPGFAFQVQAGPAQAVPAQAAQIQIQAAPIQVQIQPLPAIAPAPVWIGGGGGMMGQLPDGIKVIDEKGNALPIVGLQQNFIGNPAGQFIRVWEVRVMQAKDQPKVDKLTWQQMKIASVDIPFTLKDVPVQ